MSNRTATKPTEATSTLEQAPTKSVADQITLLRNDLVGLAQSVSGLVNEKIGETTANLETDAAKKTTELQQAITSNPMQAAAIAAGVGFFLGILLTR
jgi:DUF883 C-terminal glycine zipper region